MPLAIFNGHQKGGRQQKLPKIGLKFKKDAEIRGGTVRRLERQALADMARLGLEQI